VTDVQEGRFGWSLVYRKQIHERHLSPLTT
jgi:hypothetical protein